MLREAIRDAWGVLNGAGKVAAAGVMRQSQDAQHLWQTSSLKHAAEHHAGSSRSQLNQHQTYYSPGQPTGTSSQTMPSAQNMVTDAASRVNALAQGAMKLAGAQLRRSVPPPLQDFAGMILPERGPASSTGTSTKLSLTEHNAGIDDVVLTSAPTSAIKKPKTSYGASSSYAKVAAASASPSFSSTNATIRVKPRTIQEFSEEYVKNVGRLRSVMHKVVEKEENAEEGGIRPEAELAALASNMPSISAMIRAPPPGTVPSPGPMGPTTLPGDTGPIDRPGGSRVPPPPSDPRPDRPPSPPESDGPRPHDSPLPPDSQRRPPAPGRQYPMDDPAADRKAPEREPGDINQPSSYKLKSSSTSSAFGLKSSSTSPMRSSNIKSSSVYSNSASSAADHASSRISNFASDEVSFKIPVQTLPVNRISTGTQRSSFTSSNHDGIGGSSLRPRSNSEAAHPFEQKLGERARQRKVPATRLARLASFGSLAAGLGIGTVAEAARRLLPFGGGDKNSNMDIFATGSGATSTGRGGAPFSAASSGGGGITSSAFLSEANAERIVNTLCTVRGAALKLGQMLSIQDSSMLNPQLQRIFERVRQSADFMPEWQMRECLVKELGADWRSKLAEFDEVPFAAASIGQVHRALLKDGRQVALKIQYPGVADGINSDIDNLMSIMKYWNILPKGLYMENVMKVARQELTWECDYIREAEYMTKFRNHLAGDPVFAVPETIPELCTKHILTTELVPGVSLDKMTDATQAVRNLIALNIIRLCLAEVFEWRLMQTDPNWANFFFDAAQGRIYLLDFGATREFNKEFTDGYIQVIKGAAEMDRNKVYEYSKKLGFLTGYETKEMQEAHVDAVMILGEGFTSDTEFDFGKQDTTRRIQHLIPIMMEQRLTPPPEESYSLHRKTSGCFLLCAKLNARVRCKPIFDRVWSLYHQQGGSGAETASLDCDATTSSKGWSQERRKSMTILI